MVRPETIKGVEVYAAAGMIRAQYDRSSFTQCGLVAIWTR
jgi:hypothetical protein